MPLWADGRHGAPWCVRRCARAGGARQVQWSGVRKRLRAENGEVRLSPGAEGVNGPGDRSRPPGSGEHLAHGDLVHMVSAGVRDLVLVHEDRNAVLRAETLGRSDVIVVGMGHQDGCHGVRTQS